VADEVTRHENDDIGQQLQPTFTTTPRTPQRGFGCKTKSKPLSVRFQEDLG
jgi:hypothetical protein